MANTPLRVAVIGAGAGGLTVCRHMLDNKKFVVTVFEQTGAIGGTWVYTDFSGKDPNGLPIHSSMYKNLETNLPKEAMAYLDFPFPEEGRSFIPHSRVLKYLEDYCRHFEIMPHIKFNTAVVNVSPIEQVLHSLTWEVVVQNVNTKAEQTLNFDAVAVCNGHFSIPIFPDIPGMNSFTGIFLHSHAYRTPEQYAGKTVAILGAGPSGTDIAMEIAPYASEIFVCHKLQTSALPMNLKQMTWPVSCDACGMHFENGDYFKVDVIIVCTGYEYAFPFLDGKCAVRVIEKRVTPLYKHFLNTKYPSMALIGIPFGVLPFPLMDMQAQIFQKILDGSLKLPSAAEMNLDTESELKELLKAGNALRHFHRMGHQRFERHMTDLAELADVDLCNQAIHKLFKETYFSRNRDITNYRNVNYGISSNEFYIKS